MKQKTVNMWITIILAIALISVLSPAFIDYSPEQGFLAVFGGGFGMVFALALLAVIVNWKYRKRRAKC